MSELENVNGGLGFKKKFLFQSLGQVLGYDDCYDSGTCPHDLLSITVKGLAAMRTPSLSLPRPCAITQFQTETFWRNRLSPERLRESIQYLAIAKSLDYSFAIFLSWYLKNKVPPIAISKTDPTTINVFIFFCFIHEPFPKFCFHRQRQLKDSTPPNILDVFAFLLLDFFFIRTSHGDRHLGHAG